MAPSVSREYQPGNWLIRLLGVSIVMCSLFSIVQFGTVTTLTTPSGTEKRLMRSGLNGDSGLVLVVEKSADTQEPSMQSVSALDVRHANEQSSQEQDALSKASSQHQDTLSNGGTPAPASTEDPIPASPEAPTPVSTEGSLAPSAEKAKSLDTDAPTTSPPTHAPLTTSPSPPTSSSSSSSKSASKPTPKSKAPAIVPIPEPKVRAKSGTKGIIMCLHDRIIPLGISLIRELRCLGNEEVIEVYHCNELSADSLDLLQRVDNNIKVIDICSNLVHAGVMTTEFADTFKSYWIKPLAIHQSELEEIIMLDADDILMKDPATLRANPGYVEKGTLFFYDRVIKQGEFFNRQYEPVKGKPQGQYLKHWLRKFDYARFNSTYGPSMHLTESFAYRGKTCHEQDSSMLLINKKDNTKAMAVLWFLITEERFKYTFSWGDKEAFWLAYEFSQSPYYFSPWGASVVSSTPNNDLGTHPNTLCGSLAHYVPVDDAEPELLYINGKALVDPVPFGLKNLKNLRANQVFNMLPTHMAPRQERASVGMPEQGKQYLECLTGLGSTPVPSTLLQNLWRRRLHFMAISMNLLEPLASCSLR